MEKYPLVIKFLKTRLPQIEKLLVKSGKFQLPLNITKKRLGRSHLYLVMRQRTRITGIDAHLKGYYQTFYTAEITHFEPDEEGFTYLSDKNISQSINTLEAIFAVSPVKPQGGSWWS